MKDKNGVELVVGDEFVSENGLTWKITEFKEYAFAICEEKNWDGFYESGEIIKKPDPLLDMRGVEITVDAHVWYIADRREYVVKRCHTESVTIEAENPNVAYIVTSSKVIVLP